MYVSDLEPAWYSTKSLKRSPVVEDFYGTGIEIWAGFGPVGIIEKKKHLDRF